MTEEETRDLGVLEELAETLRELAAVYPGTAQLLRLYVEGLRWGVVEIKRLRFILEELARLLDGLGTPGHILQAGQCNRVNELLAEFAAGGGSAMADGPETPGEAESPTGGHP